MSFRTSLPLVIASPCADVSFSSLADSSSTDMALDTSVIKESRTPDAACPSLLDVSALDSPVQTLALASFPVFLIDLSSRVQTWF